MIVQSRHCRLSNNYLQILWKFEFHHGHQYLIHFMHLKVCFTELFQIFNMIKKGTERKACVQHTASVDLQEGMGNFSTTLCFSVAYILHLSSQVCRCDPSVPEPPTECQHLYAELPLTVEWSGQPPHHSGGHLPNIRPHQPSLANNVKHTQNTYNYLNSKLIEQHLYQCSFK